MFPGNSFGQGPNTWNGMFAGLYVDYNGMQVTGSDGLIYVATKNHTAILDNKPVTGVTGTADCPLGWSSCWTRLGNFNQVAWVAGKQYRALNFTSDRSYYSGTAEGNGDYTLNSGSSAIGLMPTSYDVLPYDITGAMRTRGTAGAYEY